MDHPFVKQCLQNITWATEKQIKNDSMGQTRSLQLLQRFIKNEFQG